MEQQLTIDFRNEPELDELEAKVWAVIKGRGGKGLAISVHNLLKTIGLAPESKGDEREVRRIVERLVKEHGLPIGSSCERGHSGYYHITDPAELTAHRNFLIRVAMKYLVRAKRLRDGVLGEITGRLELELNSENGGNDGVVK